jgi:hypothetical protein
MDLFKKNRKYRFIAIAIAAIVALALIASAFSKRRRPVANAATKAVAPLSHATQELLSFDDVKPVWKSMRQSDGQLPLFDLFTSPNVYWDGGQLVMEPCNHWQFDFVFPLRLKQIVKKKYRFQLEGYIQAESESAVVILIHDLENNQTLRCSVGQKFKTLGMEILSFQMHTTEKDDLITNIPVVRIRDTLRKIDVELTGDTKYYDDKYDAILEDLDCVTYTLSDPDEEIKIGESTCVLKSIDTHSNTVSIVLIDADRQEFHRKLRILK